MIPMRWFGLGLILSGVFVFLSGMHAFKTQKSLGEEAEPIQRVEASSDGEEVVYSSIPEKGEHFADLVIPKLSLRLPVVEGTGEKELSKGIGHYPESVFPGERDNAVLAGHRESRFRDIGKLKEGDTLIVATRDEGTFVFTVRKMWVTDKEDRTVIVPHDEAVLTLVTCYPFHYVGAAPKRYIVQAVLSEVQK